MAIARVIKSDDMIKKASETKEPKLAKVIPDALLEKVAAPSGMKDMAKWIGLGALAPTAADLIQDTVGKIKDHSTKKNSWKKIVAAYPDLDNDETREVYEAMFDLSPSIMKHRSIAVPALRQASGYSTGGIPTQLAQTLISTDAARTRGNPRISQNILSGANIGLGVYGTSEKARMHQENLDEKYKLTQKREDAQNVREEMGPNAF